MSRLGSWRVWISSTAILLAFAGVFFASSASFSIPTVEDACRQTPLDVRPFSTGAEVGSFLDACGPAGRDAYRSMQVADLFYPLAFGLFMASSLAMVLCRLFPWRPSVVAVAGLALVGTGFDYLENVFAWRALAAFPEPAATNHLLGFASAAKSLTFWLAGLVLLLGLAVLVGRGARRRIGGRGRAPLTRDDAISQ